MKKFSWSISIIAYIIGICIVCTMGFLYYNYNFITHYKAANVRYPDNDISNLKKFIEDTSYKNLYSTFLQNHDKSYDIQNIDYPVGREDPFVPIIDVSKDKSGTLLFKFLQELKPAVEQYYEDNDKYPVKDEDDTEIDLSKLTSLTVKDDTLSEYHYYIDNTGNPIGIIIKDSQGQEVNLDNIDISKLKIVNIGKGSIPKVALSCNGDVIVMALGEEYKNIKICEINSSSNYVVVKDNSSGSEAKLIRK